MRSPPILQEDVHAEASAAQARDEGAAVIRSHLNNHLDHNPGRSSDFVTWLATLHPENADVAVDQRFFIPGNPWWRIYEEQVKNQALPSATAVPVNDVEASIVPSAGANNKAPKQPHFCLLCSPVDLLGGMLVALFAFLAVFMTETLALAFYFVGAFFFNLARPLNPPNVATGIFYSFFMIIYFSFAVADSALLLSSIIATEFCAISAWFFSLFLGGILRANDWHQFIRRNCHLVRAACRRHFVNPPRQFCSFCDSSISKDGDKVTDESMVQPDVVVLDPSDIVVQQHQKH